MAAAGPTASGNCIGLRGLLRRFGRLVLVVAAGLAGIEVIFLLILTELYRLLSFYLREHRISVALFSEVAR